MSIYGFIHTTADGFYDTTLRSGFAALMPGQEHAEEWRRVWRDSSVSYGSANYFRVTGKTYYTRGSSSTRDYPTDVDYTAGNSKRRVVHWYGDGALTTCERITYNANGTLDTHARQTWERQFSTRSGRPTYKARSVNYSWNKNSGTWTISSQTNWPGYWTDVPELTEHVDAVPEEEYAQELNTYSMLDEAGYVTPDLNQVFGGLYLSAARSLPEADVNLIGNIKEAIDYVCSGISAIRDPGSALSSLAETFTSPKDLWLQYRYVYKTNQADAKELQELVSRLNYLSETSQSAISVKAYENVGDARYGISFKLPISSMLPDSFVGALRQFGARITPSNMWDLVPYSFMVDWFLGIGDKLSFLEDWKRAAEILPKGVWYTCRKKTPSGTIYWRYAGKAPSVPPLYQSHSASGKVVTMRIADTISIFT